MKKKPQIPETDSIEELAKFWDTHDVTEFEDELEEVTEPVFASNLRISIVIQLESEEAKEVEKIAESRGMGRSMLLREWVREKLRESGSGSSGAISDNDRKVPFEEKVEEAKTAADLFAGRIGRIRSGGLETLSEDTGKAFTEYVLQKKRDGNL